MTDARLALVEAELAFGEHVNLASHACRVEIAHRILAALDHWQADHDRHVRLHGTQPDVEAASVAARLPECAICGHDTWIHNQNDDWRCIPGCGCNKFHERADGDTRITPEEWAELDVTGEPSEDIVRRNREAWAPMSHDRPWPHG